VESGQAITARDASYFEAIIFGKLLEKKPIFSVILFG